MRINLKILPIFFLSISFLAKGQDFRDSEKYERLISKNGFEEGYIVSMNGDTLNGLIKFRSNSFKEISSFWFYNDKGKRTYVEPMDVKGLKCGYLKYHSHEGSIFLIVYEGRKVDLVKNVTVTNGLGLIRELSLSYIEHVTDGRLTVEFWDLIVPNVNLFWMLHKEEQEYIEIRKKDFTANYAEIFDDCNELVTRIEEESYQFNDLNTVIREYDFCDISN